MPLSEMYALLKSVFDHPLYQSGEITITLSSVLLFVLVLSAFGWLARWLRRFLYEKILARLPLENETRDFVARSSQYLVLLLGVNYALRAVGVDLSIFNYQLFEIRQTPVTLSSLIMFGIVLTGFGALARLVRVLMLTKVLAHLEIEEGTRYSLTRITQYLVMVIGALVAFQFVGVDLSGLVVIFGLLSVGIGFGLQNITSNFVSGLILLFERPIKVGDRVTVSGTEGDVVEINIRSTTIRAVNNVHIIVPNSEFVSSTVVNWSYADPRVRLLLEVGVDYDSDLDLVLRALREVADEEPEVLPDPAPEVHFLSFGDSAWNMQLRVWIADPKRQATVRSNLNCAIVRKFRALGIDIPFPQRDVHLRSPLPLPFVPHVPKEGNGAETQLLRP